MPYNSLYLDGVKRLHSSTGATFYLPGTLYPAFQYNFVTGNNIDELQANFSYLQSLLDNWMGNNGLKLKALRGLGWGRGSGGGQNRVFCCQLPDAFY